MGLDDFQTDSKDQNNSAKTANSNSSGANRQYSDDELLDLLRQFHNEEPEKLSKKNFTSHEDYPSGPTIVYRFGSWSDGLEEAGIESNSGGKWNGKFVSEDVVIQELQRFVKEESTKLTYDSFNATEGYPSSKTVENRFGSWNEGLEAAGISKNKDMIRIEATPDMYEPSSDKAYILGVLMGDGCVNVDKSMILAVADKDFACEYGRKFCSWAGLEWHGFDDNRTQVSCNIRELEDDNHSEQYVVKKGVADIAPHLLQYKYPSDAQSVVDEFESYEVEMLRGLWDSEGWVKKDGRVGFANGHIPTVEIYLDILHYTLEIDKSDISVYEYDSSHVVVMIPSRLRTEFMDIIDPTIQRKIDRSDDIGEVEPRSKGAATGNSILSDYKK